MRFLPEPRNPSEGPDFNREGSAVSREGFDGIHIPAHGTTSHSNASATGSPQAKIDVATGKITRVVDIAEAPWRVIGLLLTPVVSVLVVLGEFYLGTGRTPGV